MSSRKKDYLSGHSTSHYWFLESLIGLTGAILNSSVFYIFYVERQNLISTVNVMTRQEIFKTDSFTSNSLFQPSHVFSTFVLLCYNLEESLDVLGTKVHNYLIRKRTGKL